MTDAYYTPEVLADKLVSYIDLDNKVKNVADFCVGDGQLLRAAEKRWPEIICYGSDLSQLAINETRKRHKNWHLSRADFLNRKSCSLAKIFKAERYFDLILLNPPFSCLGGTLNKCSLDGLEFSTSTSMRFIVEALKYLSPTGILYAILPLSVAYSQKDRKIWNALEKKYYLAILEETSNADFLGCAPNIIIVSLNDKHKQRKIRNFERSTFKISELKILRGKLSMHRVKDFPGKTPLVHTTNLRHNSIECIRQTVEYPNSTIEGPAVLIPRVGNPDRNKICLVLSGSRYCLSDCIIAIKCSSNEVSTLLLSFILNNWEDFSRLYRGTGAHYITSERISLYLNMDVTNLATIDHVESLMSMEVIA
ncbi:methyltransferase [Algoriphagus aquimarinus]|uniref:Methyltransferase small domain-containing protein n=1 Tax=Algoriphagus aquimarinus TaxID=237018 RepID=A0A1I1BQN2_9BACT|nr:methyltransferase [Algoriphagus aquimarinus]SFB50750.1 Methyltransferase small domain-containing protein [Algoriphagus aquimarinus]